MDVWNGRLNYFVVLMMSTIIAGAVPPEACFANFRSDDCGGPPTAVMYYWKPGSRCEVGIWRGCHPNINMFHDEYECINTCMFVARAKPEDYHNYFVPEDNESVENVTDVDDSTVTGLDNVTGINATTPTISGGETGSEPTTGSGTDATAHDATQSEQSSDVPTTIAE